MKRAFVQVDPRVTGASRIFTQDIEDSADPSPESSKDVTKETKVKDVPRIPPRRCSAQERLKYDLSPFQDSLDFIGEADTIEVRVVKKLNPAAFKATRSIMDTYKAKMSSDGSVSVFTVAR